MFTYAFIIAVTTLLAYIYTRVCKEQQKYIFVLLVIFPGFFAGVRGCGTDYRLYSNNYDQIVAGTFELSDYNSLLVQFVRLVGKLGGNFQFAIFVISILTIYLAFKIIDDYKMYINVPFAVFSYMIVFYQMSFNIYRQLLAAEIFLLATKFLFLDKDNKKFWLSYIVSVWNHSSILPFGLIFFARKWLTSEKRVKSRCVVYILGTLIVLTLPLVADRLATLTNILAHYAWFLTRFEYTSLGFGIFRFLIMAILPVCVIWIKRCYTDIKQKGLGYLPFYAVMGMILWLTSYISTSSLYRIGYNFLVVLPLLHGYVFKEYNKKSRILVTMTIIAIMCLFGWYDSAILNSGETIPYLFYWNR